MGGPLFSALACLFAVFIAANTMDSENNRYPEMPDSVVIDDYVPFQEGNRLAKLDGPASLRLDGDLPVLDGATGVYPLYAAIAQAVYPEKDAEYYSYWRKESLVRCSRTQRAYERLIDGKVDAIFASVPSAEVCGTAREAGVTLTFTPVALGAFVFFVNPDNPVTGLTSGQLREIYAGRLTNWRDAGGRDARIIAFQRNPGSGSQSRLEVFMGDMAIMSPTEHEVVEDMGELVTVVSDYRNHPDAIGYSFLFYVKTMLRADTVRLLEVDGAYPDAERIRDGRYPLVNITYMVTADNGRPENPNLKRVREWILSPEGGALVERTGFVSVTGREPGFGCD